jgi:restriction system protein
MSPIIFAGTCLAIIGCVFTYGYCEGRRSNYRKHIGEALVINALEECVPTPYHLINNVTLRTSFAKIPTTQIDHILVSRAGVFVIETKHLSGTIIGNPKEPQWHQIFGRREIAIRNPIFQNRGHVSEVKMLLGLPSSMIYNVIVFSGCAELTAILRGNVLSLGDIPKFFRANRPNVLDENAMAIAIGRIEMNRFPRSQELDEYHLQGIKARLRNAA